ncbi:hypothetical protein M422DRAFT_32755 [Sphaerobolus stellatus SS14]|uniref:Uncharacterized protein n=1 Tax=Sphaerobolus stellatus (strain SS14) TaxID=990650 RepID=A0A0C9V5N1_SPHS4|nr:hypothetical protein M422DRAFT_35686 [Sphaerobolus stellatus SS14]KIJ39253.1 hypothetical protein M422DRAFT_32755 [Sphaerobolus stellatus SS14]
MAGKRWTILGVARGIAPPSLEVEGAAAARGRAICLVGVGAGDAACVAGGTKYRYFCRNERMDEGGFRVSREGKGRT